MMYLCRVTERSMTTYPIEPDEVIIKKGGHRVMVSRAEKAWFWQSAFTDKKTRQVVAETGASAIAETLYKAQLTALDLFSTIGSQIRI